MRGFNIFFRLLRASWPEVPREKRPHRAARPGRGVLRDSCRTHILEGLVKSIVIKDWSDSLLPE